MLMVLTEVESVGQRVVLGVKINVEIYFSCVEFKVMVRLLKNVYVSRKLDIITSF